VKIAHLVIVATIAGAVALAAPGAPAQPAVSADGARPDLESLAGELDLTRDQLARIRTLVDTGRKQEIALQAEMETIEVDLRRELASASPDEGTIAGWADKLAALDGSARKSRILTWVRLRKVLTRSQQHRLESLHGNTSAVGASLMGGRTGKLAIMTSPVAARISIDGREVGRSPIQMELAPGVHQVRAESAEHRTITRQVTLQAGQEVQLALELDADASPSSDADCDEVSCLVEPERACCAALRRKGGRDEHVGREDISRGIAAVRDRVNGCASRYDFHGMAKATIAITPEGVPSAVYIGNDVGSTHFQRCMTAALKKARFPRARQATSVRYPFVF